jgi:hypothetical protein
MSSLIVPQCVYCDEAGFTGDRMLDAQQPMFTYGTVAIDEAQARDIVERIRLAHRVEAEELKGGRLMRSRAGRAVVLDTLRAMRGRYLVTAYDKKLSLACKFFEYIFEPVLARNNRLFYENDFHKFVATLVYINFLCSEQAVVQIVTEFERFMRSLDPQDAPILFDGQATDSGIHESLADIAHFIDGYREIILQESTHVGDWVLDLSISALWSHLAHWSDHFPILHVLCDDSKPLRDLAPTLDVMVNRPDQVRVRMWGKDRPLTFNLARPVEFGSSVEHPGLQLADVASSAFMQVLTRRSEDWSGLFFDEFEPHVHEDCILPDTSYMDLRTPAGAVNALILRELGQRAIEGRDPLHGMEDWYAIGHAQVHRFLEGLN